MKALLFIFFLVGLTASFKKVAEWFQDTKSINIIPEALIEMVAVFIFICTYGSDYTDEIIWMWVSIAVVLIITAFNLARYGIKDGTLASFAELVFSVAAAFLLICIILARETKRKKRRYK